MSTRATEVSIHAVSPLSSLGAAAGAAAAGSAAGAAAPGAAGTRSGGAAWAIGGQGAKNADRRRAPQRSISGAGRGCAPNTRQILRKSRRIALSDRVVGAVGDVEIIPAVLRQRKDRNPGQTKPLYIGTAAPRRLAPQ